MHDTNANQRESFNGADKIINATYGMMKSRNGNVNKELLTTT